MGLNYSDVESKRFGMRIYRGQYEDFNEEAIERIVNEGIYDIIIVRYPTSTIYEHYKLLGLHGCKVVHADSLVYYSAPIQKIEIKPLRNELLFETITSESERELDYLVKTIFSGYQNHYYSNPCLKKSDIIDGYLEWAKSYANNTEKGVTWLIKDKVTRNIVAFLACSYDLKESISELRLGGVMPKFEGHGIYSDFVRYAQLYFKDMGIAALMTSTQLQNISVQRAWQSHGFRFDKSYETYHIIKDSLWNERFF